MQEDTRRPEFSSIEWDSIRARRVWGFGSGSLGTQGLRARGVDRMEFGVYGFSGFWRTVSPLL